MEYQDYYEYALLSLTRKKTVAEKVKEFHKAFGAKTFDKYSTGRNCNDDERICEEVEVETLAANLIIEEFDEFITAHPYEAENILKELADLVYVCYGYADRWGWNLDEAITRVHLSNMSKLGLDGKPILREDGKILKGSNYKEAVLDDLV